MIPQALGLIRQNRLRGPGQSWRWGTLVHVRVGPALAVGVALAVCLIVAVDPAVTAQIRGAVRQAAVWELQVVLRGVVQLWGRAPRLSQDTPQPARPSLISDQIPDPRHQPSISVPNQVMTLTSGQSWTADKPPPLTRTWSSAVQMGRVCCSRMMALSSWYQPSLVPCRGMVAAKRGASAQRRALPQPHRLPGLPGSQPTGEEVLAVLPQLPGLRVEAARAAARRGRQPLAQGFEGPAALGGAEDHDGVVLHVVEAFDRRRRHIQERMLVLGPGHVEAGAGEEWGRRRGEEETAETETPRQSGDESRGR